MLQFQYSQIRINLEQYNFFQYESRVREANNSFLKSLLGVEDLDVTCGPQYYTDVETAIRTTIRRGKGKWKGTRKMAGNSGELCTAE